MPSREAAEKELEALDDIQMGGSELTISIKECEPIPGTHLPKS
ncbi:hypothetical protein [Mucilaginibacter sp.]